MGAYEMKRDEMLDSGKSKKHVQKEAKDKVMTKISIIILMNKARIQRTELFKHVIIFY